MLKATLVALAVLVVIVLIVTAIGYSLPRGHVASGSVRLPGRPERVFAVLVDIDRYPAWRSDVKTVEVLARAPVPRWREDGTNGTITFELENARPPNRMTTRIADRTLPFGGSWTYELSTEGEDTRLTITENGEIYNPIFRFLARFVFGHTATLDRCLADLESHLRKG